MSKEDMKMKIVEILGLETDECGNENMLLIRNEKGKILYGIDYTEEVNELVLLVKKALYQMESANDTGLVKRFVLD